MLENNAGLGLQAATAPTTTSADLQKVLEIKLKLEAQLKNSAGWFFAIAGLSLVNTILVMTGAKWHFFFGLGVTEIVDAMAQRLGSAGIIAALVVNVFIAAVVVLFGVFARRGQRWAFIVGMVAYGLDGLLFLVFRDFIGVAIHAYALWAIYRGVKALDPLEKIERATLPVTPTPIA